LASRILVAVRWVASERNPADAPSRVFQRGAQEDARTEKQDWARGDGGASRTKEAAGSFARGGGGHAKPATLRRLLASVSPAMRSYCTQELAEIELSLSGRRRPPPPP